MRLLADVFQNGLKVGVSPMLSTWLIGNGLDWVMNFMFLTICNAEWCTMMMHSGSDVSIDLSCRKEVPGSCLTFSNSLARSGDMSTLLSVVSCWVEMGDSFKEVISRVAELGCFVDDSLLFSLLEIVVGLSSVRNSSLGGITCW